MMKFDTDISHSLWQATAPKQEARASLSGTHECDVAIIGGGYTGLSAALHLAEQGIDTCVLEARHSGWGASGRAGGQVNPALPVATPDLLFKTMPQEFATRLAKASLGSAAKMPLSLPQDGVIMALISHCLMRHAQRRLLAQLSIIRLC